MSANLELLMPFVLVAYTMWATPGPNNMMLVYSGAKFGIRATLPHIFGILAGTVLLNSLAVLGLKPLIETWPETMLVLKVLGSVWLIMIGWKMANARQTSDDKQVEKPMRFIMAVLFQFANPKAISATLALVSLVLVAIEQDPQLFWLVLLIIPPLSFLSITPWAVAGRAIRRFLSTEMRWKIFTWGTGGLTASCALFLWV
ncbi:LysE family translocator [Aliamphritea ceti]|uniref:LysE family translocator n=1 Tax=Aliamphritea ceti TaxID=1524258 RepID=UPI0021C26100|nr:LysE family translocator [Aliamphritea ceti]